MRKKHKATSKHKHGRSGTLQLNRQMIETLRRIGVEVSESSSVAPLKTTKLKRLPRISARHTDIERTLRRVLGRGVTITAHRAAKSAVMGPAVVISRPYLAPFGADTVRVKRIARAVKKVSRGAQRARFNETHQSIQL